MLSLVRIALRRPCTFLVLAIFILIVGPLAAWRTPTDIFPQIRNPVIAVIWQYTGLPPDQMAGRITSPFERVLTTTVNDIRHIEAQVASLETRRSVLELQARQLSANVGLIEALGGGWNITQLNGKPEVAVNQAAAGSAAAPHRTQGVYRA